MIELECTLARIALSARFKGELAILVAVFSNVSIGPLGDRCALIVVRLQLYLGGRELECVHFWLELVLDGRVGGDK